MGRPPGGRAGGREAPGCRPRVKNNRDQTSKYSGRPGERHCERTRRFTVVGPTYSSPVTAGKPRILCQKPRGDLKGLTRPAISRSKRGSPWSTPTWSNGDNSDRRG